MSATGYTPISLYYSTTAAAVPLNTNLVSGELAINIQDEKLYFKNAAGTVKLLASNATSAPVLSFSAGTTGFTPSSATSGAITLAGTLAPTNGGTGLTTLATGSLTYGAGTSAFSTLAIGTAGQILTVNSGATAPQWSTLTGVAVTTFSAGTTGFTPSSATSGAITLAGTLATTNGGTGLTSFTSGGALYATSTSVLATGTLPNTAGGTGQSSAFTQYGITYASTTTALATTAAGTTTTVLHGNASGAPTFGAVSLTADVSGILPIANGGTGASTLAGANIALINTAQTFSATQTFNGSSSTEAMKILNIAEPANVVGSAPSATTNFYVNSGSVQYYTTNAANNWTLNIAFSSGTSLNTAMATNDSISITMLATQGSTAYYNSAVTIDGTSVTPKWQGGTAPTSGNASGIDSYTYVILKTASATYTVLASQTKFA